MSKANVLFSLNGVNLTIKCTPEDKMKVICKNYSEEINKNIESLIFLYEGNKVNFELSFKEQANYIDRNNHQMKILVSECDEKNNLNSEKLDEIKNSINNIKLKMENNIKISSNNLLENIKSIYFYRILFSLLDEKIKLKLIKYNKKMQSNLDIKLINYKFYSGKYVIYENEIIGKEYYGYNNDLIFEGEFLNGERWNGKGKEYVEGKLKFEGKYLNGKKTGKGKEYDDGKLIFEGEYLNGKKNGKGKEYYYNGKLRFEGEYLNEERLNGKLYDKNDNLFCDLMSFNGIIKEYDYLNGKRNGKGKEYYLGELRFEGDYLDGKRNGKGKEYIFGSLIFEGEYLNDKKNGKGKEYDNGKLIFEGEFINGKRWNGLGYDKKDNKFYEFTNGDGYIKEYDFNGELLFEGNIKMVKKMGKEKNILKVK